MKTKLCTKCNDIKPIDEFYLSITTNDGVNIWCKVCDKIRMNEYHKTINGFFTVIYNNQRRTSKERGHPIPNYTKQELMDWSISQSNFKELWEDWIKNGYNKNLTPSFDRKNDYKPYTLSNLNPITTWEKHNKKSYKDRKNGINNKHSKAVIGINLKTKQKVEFHSIMEAERQLGISNTNISSCCNKKEFKRNNRIYQHKSAGNYSWEFKK